MKYMSLDQRGQVQAEYIWIDAVGGTRSKTKVSYLSNSCCSLFSFWRLSIFGGGVGLAVSLSLDRSLSISPVHGVPDRTRDACNYPHHVK